MTVRNFCDLCDVELEEDDEIFYIKGDTTSSAGEYQYRDSISVNVGVWIPKKFSFTMVCTNCYTEIRLLVNKLKEKGNIK